MVGRAIGLALLCMLSACGKQRDLPGSPSAPPKPVTSLGASIITAQYVLPGRQRVPAPGMM
jgi:hypothetical protein